MKTMWKISDKGADVSAPLTTSSLKAEEISV